MTMGRRRDVRIERLAWDEWNRAHIARHDVTPEEAEQVCFGRFIAIGSYKRRILLVGPTERSRMLGVVVGPTPAVPGTYYVFTARPASRKERRQYAEEMEGWTR